MKEYIYGVDHICITTVALDRGLITAKIYHAPGCNDVKQFHVGEAVFEREFEFNIGKPSSLPGQLRHAWNFFNKLEAGGEKSDYWKECVENYRIIPIGKVLISDTRYTGNAAEGHPFLRMEAKPNLKIVNHKEFANNLGDQLNYMDHYDRACVISSAINAMKEVAK